ncbi:MAG TPA: tRNA lysidine(34) synthetase TilS [Fimbriimonadaceae bacterium]|nr:tRNA lysidine(34) synthetase TilS [Fimbriimonadaceae bacterium]HRJ96910.1 tRNA lysidine(34) synthetase TilS [Fimbriimonadaceae bacterium]
MPQADFDLIPPESRVLVAYSGGADSTCLLVLCQEAGLDIVAGHLHHGQRPDAEAEAEQCAAFCESLGVPFVLGRADVPSLARDERIGLEEAGRRARYAFLRSAAAQTACRVIATGHTRDDLIETVLFNLVRGTGLAGLAGIRAQTSGLVRPLLAVSRAETRAFCRDKALWFHDDPANDDLRYSRARLRHRVLPELRQVHSGADASIARASEIARMETDYLDAVAAAALEACEAPLNGELRFLTLDAEFALDRGRFDLLHEVVARRGLRLAVRALGANIDWLGVGRVLEGLRSDQKGAVTAEGGVVVVEWTAERVHIRKHGRGPRFRLPLTVPGSSTEPELGWTIQVEPSMPSRFRDTEKLEAVLDPARLVGGLYARPLVPGDRIDPIGMAGSKSVARVLSELKLTELARSRYPVVCDMVGPIWTPGGALSRRVAITNDSANAVRLRLMRNR